MILKTTPVVYTVQVHVDRVVQQTVIILVVTLVVLHVVALVALVVTVADVETIVVHHVQVSVT